MLRCVDQVGFAEDIRFRTAFTQLDSGSHAAVAAASPKRFYALISVFQAF
jgi:hypothetical protein